MQEEEAVVEVEEEAPPPSPPREETAWERGLRHAKEVRAAVFCLAVARRSTCLWVRTGIFRFTDQDKIFHIVADAKTCEKEERARNEL